MLTQHAQLRSQQRAVPQQLIDCIQTFGSQAPAGRGCVISRLVKKDRQFLKSEMDETLHRQLRDKLEKAYAVSAGAKVITVGFRYRRVKR
jgi:hypothetical protein